MNNSVEYRPPCWEKLSYKKCLLHIIKNKQFQYKVQNTIRGIMGNSRMATDQLGFLKSKMIWYSEKIMNECDIVGKVWADIGCDIKHIEKLHKCMTGFVRHCAETNDDAIDIINEESEVFAHCLFVIAGLQAEEDKLQSKQRIKIANAKDEEQIKRDIAELFKLDFKNKFDGSLGKPDIIGDIFRTSQTNTGIKFYAMAHILHHKRYIRVNPYPNLNEWIAQLKIACKKPNIKTDNYKKGQPAVKQHIAELEKAFFYLTSPIYN